MAQSAQSQWRDRAAEFYNSTAGIAVSAGEGSRERSAAPFLLIGKYARNGLGTPPERRWNGSGMLLEWVGTVLERLIAGGVTVCSGSILMAFREGSGGVPGGFSGVLAILRNLQVKWRNMALQCGFGEVGNFAVL